MMDSSHTLANSMKIKTSQVNQHLYHQQEHIKGHLLMAQKKAKEFSNTQMGFDMMGNIKIILKKEKGPFIRKIIKLHIAEK